MTDPTPDVKSLFGQALERPVGERAAFLDAACAGHPSVRAELDALLGALGRAGDFLNPPAARPADGATIDAPARESVPTGSFAAEEQAGVVIAGRYKLLQQIGEGGMGTVWMADQVAPVRRRVAVKLIRDGRGDSKAILSRFEAERQAIALMDHPHIAKLLDAGTSEAGQPFFVMELVKGVPLTDYCDAHRLSIPDRLTLFQQICGAVQHAHQKGVIHRDLKPSNILVESHDGKPVPKVIDFGLAKAASGMQLTDHTLFTAFGSVLGTPLYMAPEQATFNAVDVDTRADVYALGVVLYELLTGSTPLTRETVKKAALDEMLKLIREQEAPTPSSRLSTAKGEPVIAANRQVEPGKLSRMVKGELDWIVLRALAKERERRYESAAALSRDIGRHLTGEAVEACPPTMGYRLRKAFLRNRNAIRVGIAFGLLLVAGVVAASVLAIQARRAEADAIAARDAETEQREAAIEAADRSRRAEGLQNLTRYAAEMNLLQAAYDARNLAEVKRILLAQLPKSRGEDLRGPEWHYWDRKLNRQTSELRIEYATGEKWGFLRADAGRRIAISPDGQLIATSVLLADPRQGAGRYSLRVWDADTGDLRHEIAVDGERLGLVGDQHLDNINLPRVKFSADGRRVLVEATVSSNKEQRGFDPRQLIYAHWDLASGAIRPSEYRSPSWGTGKDGLIRMAYRHVSDDLTWVCESAEGEDGVAVRISRFDDPRKQVTYSGLAGTRGTLSPDGRLVVLVRPDRPVRTTRLDGVMTSPGVKAELACYRVGEPEPVWCRKLEGKLVLLDNSTCQFWFRPDGARFELLGVEDGYFVHHTFRTADGELLDTMRLFPESHDSLHRFGWGGSPIQSDSSGKRLALASRYGIEVAGVQAFGEKRSASESSGLVRVESIDGPPANFAFRPDGTLLSVHVDDRHLVVRRWPKPETFADRPDSFISLNDSVISRDGSLFAVAVPRETGGRVPNGTSRVVVRSSRGDKLLDIDFAADPSLAELNIQTGRGFWGPTAWCVFSPDGRWVEMLLSVRPKGGKPFQQFVRWDLATGSPKTLLQFDAGHPVRAALDTDRDRLLVMNVDKRGEKSVRGGSATLTAARVYEHETGRPLFELSLPTGDPIGNVFVTDDGYEGYPANRAPESRRIHFWNLTGEYVGVREKVGIWVAGETVDQSEVVRGGQVVRNTESLHPSGEGTTGRVEVWDTARRGPGDPPLFTLESEPYGMGTYLSPDGRRLILRRVSRVSDWREMISFDMYDTTTGRLLLKLPYIGPWTGGTGSGIWAADGTAFWRRMTPDGKLDGYDFRPREEAKQ